jgi:hypothetical protein
VEKSCNTIIREGIKECLNHHQQQRWPNSILSFSGVQDFVPFESYREELLPPKEDPLADK